MIKHGRHVSLRRFTLILAAASVVALATGCGSGGAAGSATPPSPASSGSAAKSAPASSVSTAASSAPARSAAPSSAPSGTTASSAANAGALEPLTIGVGGATTNMGAYWLAEANGLFQKNGLTVKVVGYNTANTAGTLVASGQVDLELLNPALGLNLAAQGKQLSFVYQLASFNSGAGSVIGSKGITSIAQLKAMGSNCRIADTGAGTILYAYSQRFIKTFDLKCQMVSVASLPAEVSVIGSSQVQAAAISYNVGLGAVQAGKATMLFDPTKMTPQLSQQWGAGSYPAYTVFGLKSAVEAKRASVVRFITTLRQANALALKMSPTDLAKASMTIKAAFGTQGIDALAPSWQVTQLMMPTGDKAGFISESDWNNALEGFATWGIPNFDPKLPAISYKSVVDMSYFNQSSS